MKKFYTLLIASAVAISGFAEVNHTLHKTYAAKKGMPSAEFSLNAFRPAKTKRPLNNTYERADETRGAEMLEGTWTFVVGENYLEGSRGYVAREFQATSDENNILTFTDVNDPFFTIVAKYFPRTHSLAFDRRFLKQEGDVYIYQEPFTYNWDTGNLDYKRVVAFYSEYEDAIVFEDDLVLAMTGYDTKSRNNLLGYYEILDMSVNYRPMGGSWTDMGNATFTDGWLIPGFGDNSMNRTYEVPLQQSVENKNLFRLVNPYKVGPLAATNECETDGYIVFDVTDPDHVVLKFANAGYANAAKGCSMFFVYNYFGTLALINPYFTPEEIYNEIKDETETYPFTTYKEGKLIFDNSKPQLDTRFGLQCPPTFGYYWKNNDDIADMNANITMPKTVYVNSVNIESGADVEYFNLQGLPVVNPEAGQIVIKRAGSVVTKEIVK